MEAIKDVCQMVTVINGDNIVGEYNLHCGANRDELVRKVGKQVYDLLIIHQDKTIDCKTLEVKDV